MMDDTIDVMHSIASKATFVDTFSISYFYR